MVYIVRTEWAGLSGGPGITQMAFDVTPPGGFIDNETAEDMVNAVRSFWQGLVTHLPNEITLTVSPVVDSYVTSTGELVTSHQSPTSPAAVTGSNTNKYMMAAGYRINVLTAGISNNRRVKGAIFVVPVGSDVYNVTGQVDSFTVGQVNTAAVAFQTALAAINIDFGVWSRPTSPGPSSDGEFHPTTGMVVSTKGAVLRGRRG